MEESACVEVLTFWELELVLCSKESGCEEEFSNLFPFVSNHDAAAAVVVVAVDSHWRY